MARRKKSSRKTEYYSISVVAERYGVHQQTLRLYEREGLLKPARTKGNTRLYSEDDLQKLEIILNLTRELGVNIAGMEVILNMREKMIKIQEEVNRLIEFFQREFEARGASRGASSALVRLKDIYKENKLAVSDKRDEKKEKGE